MNKKEEPNAITTPTRLNKESFENYLEEAFEHLKKPNYNNLKHKAS